MFKKSFDILKNNIIFIQPILLWQIVFALISIFSVNRTQFLLPKIIMWSSVFLLLIACLSGWFHINKHAVLSYNENDTQDEIITKSAVNFKKFFEGIGSNFIRTLLFSGIVLIIYFVSFWGIVNFCLNHFGIPDVIDNILKISQNISKEEMVNIFNNISESDKIIFTKWIAVLNIGFSIINFFVILYFTVMSFEGKNFIISLFLAFKFFILNIFETLSIIIVLFLIYLLINLLSVFLGANSFLFALSIIIITMYLNYYVLLIFCFYNDKTKNNSDSGAERLGQDESGYKNSENS